MPQIQDPHLKCKTINIDFDFLKHFCLMQVQAAERARPAQNMFQNRGTPQGASGGTSAGGQVDISRANVPPAANQSSQQHRSEI